MRVFSGRITYISVLYLFGVVSSTVLYHTSVRNIRVRPSDCAMLFCREHFNNNPLLKPEIHSKTFSFVSPLGQESLVYKMQDGTDVVGRGYRQRVKKLTNDEIMLYDIRHEDAGTYRCDWLIRQDRHHVKYFKLQIRDDPWVINLKANVTNITQYEDAQVKLTCALSTWCPISDVTIYRGPMKIASGKGKVLTTVHLMKNDDMKRFICQANGEGIEGTLYSNVIHFNVIYPASVVNLNISGGNLRSNATFICTSDSTLPVIYKIKKLNDNQPSAKRWRYRQNGHVTLYNVTDSDRGLYICIAETEMNSLRSEAVRFNPGKYGSHAIELISSLGIWRQVMARRMYLTCRADVIHPLYDVTIYRGRQVIASGKQPVTVSVQLRKSDNDVPFICKAKRGDSTGYIDSNEITYHILSDNGSHEPNKNRTVVSKVHDNGPSVSTLLCILIIISGIVGAVILAISLTTLSHYLKRQCTEVVYADILNSPSPRISTIVPGRYTEQIASFHENVIHDDDSFSSFDESEREYENLPPDGRYDESGQKYENLPPDGSYDESDQEYENLPPDGSYDKSGKAYENLPPCEEIGQGYENMSPGGIFDKSDLDYVNAQSCRKKSLTYDQQKELFKRQNNFNLKIRIQFMDHEQDSRRYTF